jgi:hypothetical protein
VRGPWEAAANAVGQITTAYQQKKALREMKEAKQRQQDAMRKAIGGTSTDINSVADALVNSGDPDLVDRGLQIKLQIATQGAKGAKAPTVREFVEGDRVTYRQWDGEKWSPLEGTGGPRYKPASAGGAGGTDEYAPSAQGSVFFIPGVGRVQAPFQKGRGHIYRGADGEWHDVPANAQPISSSQGGMLSGQDWYKLRKERQESKQALKALQQYFDKAGGLPQGMDRWANSISAKAKTFFGNPLTKDQFDQMDAQSQQQALIGMLRTSVVGPGIVTEYDALRIIEAMGGDPRSALQNPQVLQQILGRLYERKRQELQIMENEYQRNRDIFGGADEPLDVPDTLQAPGAPQQPGAQTQPSAPVIRYDDKGRRIK